LVGNTVVDAMRIMLGGEVTSFPLRDCAPFRILVTAHRRENFASGVKNLCMALDQLARERERLEITYVLHPNPEARRPVLEILRNVPQVHLIEAIGYRDFLTVLSNSDLVLTDSGGIQEEAPYFGRPVLVIRSRTERHEAAELGNAELSGTDTAAIVRAVSRLLDDPELYRQRAVRVEPFGDGHAAERIRADLKERSACLQ
jgi:UDP-N-acetylglucosamine 2-epimerase (non-hydrolysing)